MSFNEPIGFFVFDYAWVFFILVTILNAFSMKVRSKGIVREHPELEHGLETLFKGFLLYMNIPWVVMGIGMIFGRVPSTFSFFAPRHGNVFVIAFHVSIVIFWILGVWWLYFRSGAEFLAQYSGISNQRVRSPLFIKTYFGLSLLGGIGAMVYMWSL